MVNAYMSILIEGVAEALELAGRVGIQTARLAEAIEGGPVLRVGHEQGQSQKLTVRLDAPAAGSPTG